MYKRLPIAVGGFVLVSLLAWSSFAAAAPAAKGTPVPLRAATATPVPTVAGGSQTDSADNAPDVGVDAAAAGPVAPGAMTSRIFLFNLDASTATVGINFLNLDGTTKATIAPFSIPSNGAVAKPLPSAIKSPFSGSAVVSSDKNVQAFVTDSNSNNTARDKYQGMLSPNANLVFPFVRHLARNTQNSIIAIQNTSNAPADITLHLFDQGGNEVAAPTANGLAPLASHYFNTNAIFPSGTFTGTAQVSATGGAALAGSEQTRFMKDTASFRALTSADEATTLYVGFVERRRNSAGTPTSWSEIYVRNDGSNATDITAQFYSQTGAPALAVTRTAVPPNGIAQFLTNGGEFKSFTQPGAYFKGWTRITSSGQPLALYSLDAQNSGARLFGMEGMTSPGSKFACGDALRLDSPSQPQFSTINIVNPNASAVNATVRLYSAGNGAAAGTKTVKVGSKNLVSVVLSDAAFANAGTSFEGLAVVSSPGPQIFASVYSPYGSGGVTFYNCLRLQ
jgi:hypothetical protein